MTIKEIDLALEEGQTLKQITEAYSEIANLKIKRIRSYVERNRMFFQEIESIYGIVKAFAIKKKVAIAKPKQRLCILLTSNNRFYGNINSSLINYFIGSTRGLPDIDIIVLGKGGIDYFRVTRILPNYKEVILKTDLPTNQELTNLVSLSMNYNQVLVFHSKLKSLLTQQATSTDITAISLYIKKFYVKPLYAKGEKEYQFIFEPELPKILNFFDSQILTLLLEQTFLESELSRTASRFISMDQAEAQANKFTKEYLTLRAYAKRNMDNNAILENFASYVSVRTNVASMMALRKANI